MIRGEESCGDRKAGLSVVKECLISCTVVIRLPDQASLVMVLSDAMPAVVCSP